MERILDEALVVRGGRNRPEDIKRGIGTHPSGITGISVECGVGLSISELVSAIPHQQVGITTVSEVRKAGGDVIRTSPKKFLPCYFDWLDSRTSKRSSDTHNS